MYDVTTVIHVTCESENEVESLIRQIWGKKVEFSLCFFPPGFDLRYLRDARCRDLRRHATGRCVELDLTFVPEKENRQKNQTLIFATENIFETLFR